MNWSANTQQIPKPGTFSHTDLPTSEISTEAVNYDTARTQLGGHIGYSVRPSRRRQGHASRALNMALVRASELGMEEVLLTCDVDNVASARTIESQGGRFERILQDKRRYWVTARLATERPGSH